MSARGSFAEPPRRSADAGRPDAAVATVLAAMARGRTQLRERDCRDLAWWAVRTCVARVRVGDRATPFDSDVLVPRAVQPPPGWLVAVGSVGATRFVDRTWSRALSGYRLAQCTFVHWPVLATVVAQDGDPRLVAAGETLVRGAFAGLPLLPVWPDGGAVMWPPPGVLAGGGIARVSDVAASLWRAAGL